MNKNELIIRLFIHDIKAPLAVIEMGGRALLEKTARYGRFKQNCRELLADMLEKKLQAVRLLDSMLAFSRNGYPSRIADYFSTRFFLKRFTRPAAERYKRRCLENVQAGMEQPLKSLLEILTGIYNDIQAIKADLDVTSPHTPERVKTINRILRNARQALHLAANAADVFACNKAAFEPAPCSIAQIIIPALVEVFDLTDSDTADRLQKKQTLSELETILIEKDIFLSVAAPVWRAKFCLDCAKVGQVIVNLLLNALKFRNKRIDIGISLEGSNLTFCVADDGREVPAGYRAELFKQPLQISEPPGFPIRGHGIGLAGAQALLGEMNGYLLLENEAGRFKRFCAVIECPDGCAQAVRS